MSFSGYDLTNRRSTGKEIHCNAANLILHSFKFILKCKQNVIPKAKLYFTKLCPPLHMGMFLCFVAHHFYVGTLSTQAGFKDRWAVLLELCLSTSSQFDETLWFLTWRCCPLWLNLGQNWGWKPALGQHCSLEQRRLFHTDNLCIQWTMESLQLCVLIFCFAASLYSTLQLRKSLVMPQGFGAIVSLCKQSSFADSSPWFH